MRYTDTIATSWRSFLRTLGAGTAPVTAFSAASPLTSWAASSGVAAPAPLPVETETGPYLGGRPLCLAVVGQYPYSSKECLLLVDRCALFTIGGATVIYLSRMGYVSAGAHLDSFDCSALPQAT
jgi:hypothetical protein